MAEGRPSLGRLLASGTMRLGRQARLSRGQALALACGLVAAVGLGTYLEPRGPRHAPPSDPAVDLETPAGPVPPGPAAVALDRLAAEIAAMNRRLADAVADEAGGVAPNGGRRPGAARTRGSDPTR